MLLHRILWGVLIVFFLYVLYRIAVLVNKKYNLKLNILDNFQAKPAVNVPAPVAPSERMAIPEPPITVSPAGPITPNAHPPRIISQEFLPEEKPNDEMASVNSEVPIKNNMRHPERMFNSGVDHTGTKRAVESGISGNTTEAPAPVGKFSPDFAQNGGEFMTGIFANDLTKGGGNYSEI